MSTCGGCGDERWNVKESLGDLETWECATCGQTETVTVSRSFDAADFPPPGGPVFVVAGYWRSAPTLERIAAVKRRFPHLAAQALAEHARRNTGFELGRFSAEDLPGFEASVAELGIRLRATPLDDPR